MKNIISVLTIVLFFVNNTFAQFNFTSDTNPKESCSNKGKPIRYDTSLGYIYLDIITLPATGNKEYLQLQVAKPYYKSKVIETVQVSIIPLDEISYLDINKEYGWLKVKTNKQINCREFRQTEIKKNFCLWNECFISFGEEAPMKEFVRNKFIPSLEKIKAKNLINELCNKFDIKLESAEKDLPYNNASTRVFKSFGNNVVRNEGLPHYSTYDAYSNTGFYMEYYYELKDKYLEVTEYSFSKESADYKITYATRDIYYYEDIKDVMLVACYESKKNCNKMISFGNKTTYFQYKYSQEEYKLYNFAFSEGLSTFPRFDVQDFEKKLKDKIFDASLELEANPNKPKPLGRNEIVFDATNPKGKLIEAKVVENTKKEVTLKDQILEKGAVLYFKGNTCYKYENKFYDKSFTEIGNVSGGTYRFGGVEMYKESNNVVSKGSKIIAYTDMSSSFFEASKKTLYLKMNVNENTIYKGNAKFIEYKRSSKVASDIYIKDVVVLTDYFGL
ncbi:MAG: hypothetical protein MUC49_07120 [Raineya sp.]|jgi:hypothetical protein|nr:hypothetical protein [Raineya sp.]